MRASKNLLLALGALALALPAQAMTWENAPPSRGGQPVAGGHAPMGMTPAAYVLKEGEGATAVLWSPDLAVTPLTVLKGRITPPTTGQDNYHLLWAQREHDGIMETATRWYSGHGKPTGHSPSELTGATRSGLEVVPDPLPREHWRYQEAKPAAFKILLDGHPQTGVTVLLKTGQHTTLEGRSDGEGRVVFTLPSDLPAPAADAPQSPFNRGPKGVMTLSAETDRDGLHHLATLTADYYGGLQRDHSLAWGWTGAAGGFAVGLLLLSRRKVGGEA